VEGAGVEEAGGDEGAVAAAGATTGVNPVDGAGGDATGSAEAGTMVTGAVSGTRRSWPTA
jgi:hypothetical protein